MPDLPTVLGSAPGNGDRRPWVIGRLVSIDAVALRAAVSIDGSPAVSLPYVPGTYTGITTVFVLRDPYGTGAGQLVLGPCYAETAEVVPAPPVDDPTVTTTETALIRPTWSGTWRSIRSAYDRWNTERYGGRSTLYQGEAYGSGPLTGLAVYGDQVAALGAVSISRIVVSTPLATGSGAVTLQGATNGTKPAGAPSTTGATASGVTAVELDASMCEAFRTGAVKGLASVGANYRATYGTARASGMALSVTYTKTA